MQTVFTVFLIVENTDTMRLARYSGKSYPAFKSKRDADRFIDANPCEPKPFVIELVMYEGKSIYFKPCGR